MKGDYELDYEAAGIAVRGVEIFFFLQPTGILRVILSTE